MTTPLRKPSIKAFNASRTFQLLRTKDVSTISPPTQVEIDEFEHQLRALFGVATFASLLGLIFVIMGLIAMMIGLIGVVFGPFFEGTTWLIGGFLTIVIGGKLVQRYGDVPSVKGHTGKLVNSEACERALFLTERHTQANLYREGVLAQGREFHMLDLVLMEVISKEAENQDEAERTKERCRKLHGISE